VGHDGRKRAENVSDRFRVTLPVLVDGVPSLTAIMDVPLLSFPLIVRHGRTRNDTETRCNRHSCYFRVSSVFSVAASKQSGAIHRKSVGKQSGAIHRKSVGGSTTGSRSQNESVTQRPLAHHVAPVAILGGPAISPPRNSPADVEDDGEPFDDKMKRLTAELREQAKQSAKLDKLIRANLVEIGYGG
jgi:hypothetical protein